MRDSTGRGKFRAAHSQGQLARRIHAANVHPSIMFAEDDRFRTFALDASDYLFRAGRWYAPEKPGWGINLRALERGGPVSIVPGCQSFGRPKLLHIDELHVRVPGSTFPLPLI